MVLLVKIFVLSGGIAALGTGLIMIFFFDQFQKINNRINEKCFGPPHTKNLQLDDWVLAQRYLAAILLIIAGIFLVLMFVRYAPY